MVTQILGVRRKSNIATVAFFIYEFLIKTEMAAQEQLAKVEPALHAWLPFSFLLSREISFFSMKTTKIFVIFEAAVFKRLLYNQDAFKDVVRFYFGIFASEMFKCDKRQS